MNKATEERFCFFCKKRKKVRMNCKIKKLVCDDCYYEKLKPKKKCFICKEIKVIAKNTKKGPMCHTCYQRNYFVLIRRKEKCYFCGKLKTVTIRTKKNEPVCNICFHKEENSPCPICGKRKIIPALKKCYLCLKKEKRENKNSAN